MPRLEQREDGGYYILAYSHSKGGIVTWQVRDFGLTYLHRKNVYAGKTFPAWHLQEMIESNWVFIGGPGLHSGTVGNQSRTIMSATVSTKNSHSKSLSMKNSNQIIRARNLQKKNSLLQSVPEISHIFRKTTSLIFRKYKKRWELLIVFPKLHLDVSNSRLINGYRLTVVDSPNMLKATQIQSGNGEARIPVRPQERNYELKLISTDSSCNNLWPLLEESEISICLVKGLNLSGAVFKKHMEALQLNEGIRLDDHEVMVLGESYYVVFHKAGAPKFVPASIIVKRLGDVGNWEAWEIQLPKKADTIVRNWITRLGHTLN